MGLDVLFVCDRSTSQRITSVFAHPVDWPISYERNNLEWGVIQKRYIQSHLHTCIYINMYTMHHILNKTNN